MELYLTRKRPMAMLLIAAVTLFALGIASADVHAAPGDLVSDRADKGGKSDSGRTWLDTAWDVIRTVGTAYIAVATGARLIKAVSSGSLWDGILNIAGLGPEYRTLDQANLNLSEQLAVRQMLLDRGVIDATTSLADMLQNTIRLKDGSIYHVSELQHLNIPGLPQTAARPQPTATEQTNPPEKTVETPKDAAGNYTKYHIVVNRDSMPANLVTGMSYLSYEYEVWAEPHIKGQPQTTELELVHSAYETIPIRWQDLEAFHGCNVKVSLNLPVVTPVGPDVYSDPIHFSYIGHPAGVAGSEGPAACLSHGDPQENPEQTADAAGSVTTLPASILGEMGELGTVLSDPNKLSRLQELLADSNKDNGQLAATDGGGKSPANTTHPAQNTKPATTNEQPQQNSPSGSPGVTPQSPSNGPSIPDGWNVLSYTVKTGDTLSEIAGWFNTQVGLITGYNGIQNADHIRVGQVLKIPTPLSEIPPAAKGTQSASTNTGGTSPSGTAPSSGG